MSGRTDWRTVRAQHATSPAELSLIDALRALALSPMPRGASVGAWWFYEHAPYTRGYDDGVRIRHRDTGQNGRVVSTRLGGELYVLVHWDDTEYEPGHCDVAMDWVLEITGPAERTVTPPRQPDQLDLFQALGSGDAA